MEWLKYRRNKATAAMLAGMLMIFSVSGVQAGVWTKDLDVPYSGSGSILYETEMPAHNAVLAWWGTMYPKFCFAEITANKSEKKQTQPHKIQTAFWFLELFK